MKTIYLDTDFKCHLENDGTMTAVETNFFDGKCKTFIEGYRFVPAGEKWTREAGTEFHGETISPWKEYALLEEFQRQYEELIAQQEDMKAALELLGVSDEEAIV